MLCIHFWTSFWHKFPGTHPAGHQNENRNKMLNMPLIKGRVRTSRSKDSSYTYVALARRNTYKLSSCDQSDVLLTDGYKQNLLFTPKISFQKGYESHKLIYIPSAWTAEHYYSNTKLMLISVHSLNFSNKTASYFLL